MVFADAEYAGFGTRREGWWPCNAMQPSSVNGVPASLPRANGIVKRKLRKNLISLKKLVFYE